MTDDRKPVFVAEVHSDWTVMQVIATGEAYGFCRADGKAYCLPSPHCPFVPMPRFGATPSTEGGEDGSC